MTEILHGRSGHENNKDTDPKLLRRGILVTLHIREGDVRRAIQIIRHGGAMRIDEVVL